MSPSLSRRGLLKASALALTAGAIGTAAPSAAALGPVRGTRNRHVTGFQRLAQRFQHPAVELGQFVEKEHAVVRQRDFAGPRIGAAADQARQAAEGPAAGHGPARRREGPHLGHPAAHRPDPQGQRPQSEEGAGRGAAEEDGSRRMNLHDDRAGRLILALRRQGVTDARVLGAMEGVDRALFVHEKFLDQAWEDQALPIDCAQTISQPFIVGLMTQALDVQPRHRVLEIGTGSGYQCAVLSRLARYVYSVERYRSLLAEAEGRRTYANPRNFAAGSQRPAREVPREDAQSTQSPSQRELGQALGSNDNHRHQI